MSRVFEALSKANVDKNSSGEQQVEAAPSVIAKGASTAHEDAAAAHRTSEAVQIAYNSYQPKPSTIIAQKNWREKLEDAIFGWNLSRYASYPVVALEQDSPAAEQYKILREQVKRLRAEAGINTFTVTSPVKKDGKTTVAVNLAAALALDYDQKVLLIDGDLRCPSAHQYFRCPQSPGLADYLHSNAPMKIKDLVQPTVLPGLRILPSGKATHLASELLAKDKMNDVLAELRAEFPGYQIIIDSPPILSTPDPMVIARHVDGVLLVVRAGKTPREYLMKALRSLNSNKIMGVVLNGAELGITSKYYSYTTANEI
jgi:protein-tyrosine kinase